MLVRQLIEQLQSCDPEDTVVLQIIHDEVTPLTSVTDLRIMLRAYGAGPRTAREILGRPGTVILGHSL